jgi:hypothetical protein
MFFLICIRRAVPEAVGSNEVENNGKRRKNISVTSFITALNHVPIQITKATNHQKPLPCHVGAPGTM